MSDGSAATPSPSEPRHRDIGAIILTLAVGAVGGWLFDLLHMPLAWMIGAMVFTTVGALAGAPLKGSRRLRTVVVPVLGIMLGSAFTPEALGDAARWVPSLATMVLYIVVVTTIVGIYFHRTFGFGPITSYFSASPGGLSVMVILGGDFGGDERKISLCHSIRIMLTVLIIPFWFRWFAGYVPDGNSAVIGRVLDVGLSDAAILLACVLGAPLGRLIRLPSAPLVGPMLLSAAVHLSGITDAKPPLEIVNLAQLVIGAGIGARFAGVRISQMLQVMTASAGATVFMLVLAAAAAHVLAALTGLPFQTLWLAFAPGGLAEMTLISLAMGIDTAFVSTHHLLRVIFMVLMAPVVFTFIQQRFGLREEQQTDRD